MEGDLPILSEPHRKGLNFLHKQAKRALTSLLSFDNAYDQGNFLKGVMKVSNILGILIGVVVIIIGLILLVTWWSMFIKGLMAVIPILLILIGLGALVYFISEIKSKLEMSKEEKTTPEQK
jgi:uncharacterized membrane protein